MLIMNKTSLNFSGRGFLPIWIILYLVSQCGKVANTDFGVRKPDLESLLQHLIGP